MADETPPLQSGELLVLAPAEGAGFRVSYHNVANNFHLFTLLHAKLGAALGKCPLENEEAPRRQRVYAAARGELPVDETLSDTALWNFCNYLAARPNGNSPLLWVWGEASPDSIPTLDGVRVLLMLPMTISRSWSSGFFGPQIPGRAPGLIIEDRLSDAEFAAWMNRTGDVAMRMLTSG